MSNINELSNVPDISFIGDSTLEGIRNKMLSDYIEAYTKENGTAPELQSGSAERLMLYAFAAQFYQALQYIDTAGKMGLLKFSIGDYLDNLAALKNITRTSAIPAACTLKFTLSDARGSATGIPGGTRVSAEDIYFTTDEYMEIAAGNTYGFVNATALEAGKASNGLAIGEINTIVDPVPYVSSVTNTTVTSGGSDIEDDDSLTYRTLMAPSGYSVAGPRDAYVYWAKQARSDIEDVVVYSPSPTDVNIVFTLEGGTLPDEDAIDTMTNYLSDSNKRPLTDNVTAISPNQINYTIDLNYYINKSDSTQAVSIQSEVNEAIEEYKTWQKKIGRDISPSKLIQFIMSAGAKRVEVTAPVYTAVEAYSIAVAETSGIEYGGLEDD